MTGALEAEPHHTATRDTEPSAHDESAAPSAPDSVFSYRELSRLDEALTMSSRETGLYFSLYVGELGQRTRERAEQLHGEGPHDPAETVPIAVSPGQRVVEVVTGAAAVDADSPPALTAETR